MDWRAPAVRARGLQDALALLERRYPDAHRAMRARLPEETWRVVHESPRTAWIDVQHEHLIVDSWAPLLGDEVTDFLADAVLMTLESPLFNTLAKGAMRMFGVTPRSIIRQIPRAWSNVYRDHLIAEIEHLDADGAVLAFRDIAPEVYEAEGYPVVWKGIFEAIYRLCQHQGEARWERDPHARAGTWTLSWRPNAT